MQGGCLSIPCLCILRLEHSSNSCQDLTRSKRYTSVDTSTKILIYRVIPGIGNFLQNDLTSLRILLVFFSSPRCSTNSTIQAATFFISCSLNPRVVVAGVPSRIPEVTNGERVSLGTVFLLTVIPASPSVCCTSFPVGPSLPKSISIRWLSVPPDTIRR